MKGKPLYITLSVVVLAIIIFLFYFFRTAGDGWEADFPKDSVVLTIDTIKSEQTAASDDNPEVTKPIYHWTPEVADFTLEDAAKLASSIYDTIGVAGKEGEEDDDGVQFSNIAFFSADAELHAVVVVENKVTTCGACPGWCDVLAFKKENNKWKLTDVMLKAGGGGMYGNPGELRRLELIGNQTVGIILQGGQEHMGGNYHEDVIGLNQGKLKKILNISVHHDYGKDLSDDNKNTVCDDNVYEFIPNGRAMYDLKITRLSCLDEKSKKIKEVTISYKNGYKVPKIFNIQS